MNSSPHFRDRHMVYVVDDEASVRRSLGRLLSSLGLDSREFASGPDLLAEAACSEAACFLVDVHMPKMRGYELAERLREAAPDSPVILMSAHSEEQFRWRTRGKPAAAFLLKPFSDQALIKVLRRVLQDYG